MLNIQWQWWWIGVAVLTVVLAFAFYIRRRFVIVTVTGTSMTPTLQPGDRLVVCRRSIAELEIGDIVVLRPPRPPYASLPTSPASRRSSSGWKVKRVVALPGDPVPQEAYAATGGLRIVPDGFLIVFGDSDASHDSRRVGLYPAAGVLGVAVRDFRVPESSESV